MAYVFLLNLSFDVPVKLSSLHLLIFSLLLLSPFLPRMSAMLLNREVAPLRFPARQTRPLWHWTALGIQVMVILVALLQPPYRVAQNNRLYASVPSGSALTGIYRVLDDSRPAGPRLAVDTRWRKVAFNDRSYRRDDSNGGQVLITPLRVELVNGTRLNGNYTDDSASRTVQINLEGVFYTFNYQTKGGLTLTASDGTRLVLGLDIEATRLTTRGFCWVNEEPYNR